jgi:hypothetical protein
MGHRLLIAILAMLRRIRYDFRFWPIVLQKSDPAHPQLAALS